MQPIWDAVVGFGPQVFVWLGDNVYGDNKRPFRVFGRDRTVGPWKNAPRFYPSTEEELRRRYQLARAQPGYARLRETAQVRPPLFSPPMDDRSCSFNLLLTNCFVLFRVMASWDLRVILILQ